MTEALYFEPTWSSAPGTSLSDLMKRKGVDRFALADQAGERVEVIDELLAGRGRITNSLASAFADALGGSVDFWLRRERQYREDLTRQRLMEAEDSSEWLDEMPVSELVASGWIGQDTNGTPLQKLLSFFGVSNLSEWRLRYRGLASAVSFRTSPVFASHLGSTLSWLRIGELVAARQQTDELDLVRLRNVLPEMRALCRIKDARSFLPKLTSLCNSAGVALVVAQAPKGCRASGATWLTSTGSAICLLSQRYKTDDQFWFTFFHEMGHLCLHSDRSMFLEDGDEVSGDEEDEANQFSAGILIPDQARQRLGELPRTHKAVIRFAMTIGVSPGIVAGQMQHMRLIPYTWLNATKRRIWASASESDK